jgi:hypothetical protein
MKLTGENRSTRGKTYPSATLSTTNPTWTDPGSNPGLCGERPATNRLSHDTAHLLNLGCHNTKHIKKDKVKQISYKFLSKLFVLNNGNE